MYKDASARKSKKSAPIEISANHSPASTPQFEPILTVEQTAEIRNSHPLPVHKAGKFLRFRRSEIERWLDGKAA
jgi:hypothetical protein